MKTKEAKRLATIGKNIAKVRRSRGMSQEQLAVKTNLGSRTISAIEQGIRWPRILTLDKIIDALGTDYNTLLKG